MVLQILRPAFFGLSESGLYLILSQVRMLLNRDLFDQQERDKSLRSWEHEST